MNLQYEEWMNTIHNVNTHITRFNFFDPKCPICGSNSVEKLPQTNLTVKWGCGNCRHIWSVHYVVGTILAYWQWRIVI